MVDKSRINALQTSFKFVTQTTLSCQVVKKPLLKGDAFDEWHLKLFKVENKRFSHYDNPSRHRLHVKSQKNLKHEMFLAPT